MAYVHFDDGYPESSDYQNNYCWFDASESGLLKQFYRDVRASDLGSDRQCSGIPVRPLPSLERFPVTRVCELVGKLRDVFRNRAS